MPPGGVKLPVGRASSLKSVTLYLERQNSAKPRSELSSDTVHLYTNLEIEIKSKRASMIMAIAWHWDFEKHLKIKLKETRMGGKTETQRNKETKNERKEGKEQ